MNWLWVPSSLKLWNYARLLVTWLWGTAVLPEFEQTIVWYAETREAICKCGSITRLNPSADYRTRCGKHDVSIVHSFIHSPTSYLFLCLFFAIYASFYCFPFPVCTLTCICIERFSMLLKVRIITPSSVSRVCITCCGPHYYYYYFYFRSKGGLFVW